MRLEHHLVGGYVRYRSPYIIIINHSQLPIPKTSAIIQKIAEVYQKIKY